MRTEAWGAGPGRGAVVVLDPGDEVHDAVVRAAKSLGVEGAVVTGIGAVDALELGYFRLPEKVYDRRLVHRRVEAISLTGNLALKDGAPFLHLHGVFSGDDFVAFGGHVFRAVASITLEMFLLSTPRLERGPYPEFGLTRLLAGCPG
ncbi:MAG TPA: DUF296 domain-containing protein [Planctomycetota bacterium]|nr:DUF296 domain-containing protein [Planctomycetota bacterium]